MNLIIKALFLYVVGAWIILGLTFMYPQHVPSQEGVEGFARGMPLPFYASGTSIFTGNIPAQIAVGPMLLDLLVWFVILVAIHFVYRNFVHAGN